MFAVLVYAWASAVVSALLGTIPGRSFRFRASLVALVLAVGVVLSYSAAHFLVDPLFSQDRLPEGVRPGDWGMFGLYARALTQLSGYLLMMAVAFLLRGRLLPKRGKDSSSRGMLVLASKLVILLVVVVPLSLDGTLSCMTAQFFRLLF